MLIIRRRTPLRPLLALAAALLHVAPALAQAPTTGEVSGVVTGAAGEPLHDVLLTLSPLVAGESRTALASSAGEFRFSALAPGRYELVGEKIGFLPARWSTLVVEPGTHLELDLSLVPAAGEIVRREERIRTSGRTPGSYGGSQRLSAAYPLRTNSVARLALQSSWLDEQGGSEGLPAWLTLHMLDGVPFRAPFHSSAVSGGPATAFAVPSSGFAELVTNGSDIGWTGGAGAFLSSVTLPGAGDFRGAVAGYWAGEVGAPGFVEDDTPGFNDARGDVALQGRIGSGLSVNAGVTVARLETPLSPGWSESTAAAVEPVAAMHDVGLDVHRGALVASSEVVSGFLRADWRLGENQDVDVQLQAASRPILSATRERFPAPVEFDAKDVVASVGLRSGLSSSTSNELRVAVTASELADRATGNLPATTLVHEGAAFGDPAGASRVSERYLRITDALQLRTGAHTVRVLAGLASGAFEYDQADRGAHEFLFGSVDDLLAGRGALQRAEAAPVTADWSAATLSFGLQDRWDVLRGVQVLLGVLAEREKLPGDVARDAEWLRLSGIANDEVDAASWRLSPRVGARWKVTADGAWVVDAGAGMYHDRYDPTVLARWQTDDGSVQVRRVVGDVTWPPSGSAGGASVPRLTILQRDFAAPRTVRGNLSLTHRLDAATSLQLAGTLRSTDNLPRMTDLNLLPLPVARDQYGREVFGSLVKQGGLLVAEPGSNRRFPSYDRVRTYAADGTSEYVGVTLAVERALDRGVELFGRYTWSRTTDDWFGAVDGLTAMRPAGMSEEWENGTSDFDVPHRAVLGVAATTPVGLGLRALYRLQSGRPFTPGFRAGVDANADGDPFNDPAFIDEALPGMDALLQEWPCLGASRGEFAERNSCRADMVHTLDAGLSYRLPRLGGAGASIMVDVFDLLDRTVDVPDPALYLVDPAGSLAVDAEARTVGVPLIVNEQFGEPLARRQSGRQVRLGISVTW